MNVNEITKLARRSVLEMSAYKSARSLGIQGEVFLDANESPWGTLNRYPAPQPSELLTQLSLLYGVEKDWLTVGRGTDDAIDWLVRTFCEAGQDQVGVCPPTYGMYEVSANLQGAAIVRFPTSKENGFAIDAKRIISNWTPSLKLIFLCSPNNPTGSVVSHEVIGELAEGLFGKAIIVVDEAYIEFSSTPSFLSRIKEFPNVVVLRTLSKAWALAGARCGTAVALPAITQLLQKVRAPYPIPQPTLEVVLSSLKSRRPLESRLGEWTMERERLHVALASLPEVVRVFPSEANFLLLETTNSAAFFERCLKGGVVIRDRNSDHGLENCVRVTVGTAEENSRLLAVLRGEKTSSSTRVGVCRRVTKETAVEVSLDLDKSGDVRISTGIYFFDHMLEQLAKHGGFNMRVQVTGDLEVDEHHTVEDTALGIGEAFRQAIGDKTGLSRYGFALPMDESKAQVLLDLSGRAYFKFDGKFPRDQVGQLPTELVPHFFRSFADALRATLHMEVEGENAHHMVEALFKAMGRTLRQAVQKMGQELPSTKGIL